MQDDPISSDPGHQAARTLVRNAVLAKLNEMEAESTTSDRPELVFEILALKQRLGLPLEGKK